MQQVPNTISRVNQAAKSSNSAAAELIDVTGGELSGQSELLRGEVDRFLAGLRAASWTANRYYQDCGAP